VKESVPLVSFNPLLDFLVLLGFQILLDFLHLPLIELQALRKASRRQQWTE
jgi:hypothetical protein